MSINVMSTHILLGRNLHIAIARRFSLLIIQQFHVGPNRKRVDLWYDWYESGDINYRPRAIYYQFVDNF